MSKIVNAVERAEMERRSSAMLSAGGRGVKEILSSASNSSSMAKTESWEEATALVIKQLQLCEQQLAGQSSDLARHNQRLAALEEEKQRLTALHQEASEKIARLEKSRLAWVRQLEALKQCAMLSQAYREAGQAMEANQQRIKVAEESQKQLAGTLAGYQQQQADLQKQAEQIRFRLASALAATGTTDPHVA